TPSTVVAGLVQLGLQQRAQVGGTGRSAGFRHTLDGAGCFGALASLDRELDRTRLAVDVEDHGFDSVAGLEHGGRVFDTACGHLGGTQVAFDVDRQRYHGTLGFDRLDDALNHGTLVVGGNVVVEGVALKLLDAQGDALFLGVDGQNHGIDLVALLEVANGLFARLAPGKVGKVHQTIDAAGQTDEHAEVGDRLDGAANLVATLEVDRELFPRVLTALLHAERDTATVFVDLENHDFDFFAQSDNLARIDVLVGPVHFGNVHQTFDTVFDFNERTVVGEVRDLAEQA